MSEKIKPFLDGRNMPTVKEIEANIDRKMKEGYYGDNTRPCETREMSSTELKMYGLRKPKVVQAGVNIIKVDKKENIKVTNVECKIIKEITKKEEKMEKNERSLEECMNSLTELEGLSEAHKQLIQTQISIYPKKLKKCFEIIEEISITEGFEAYALVDKLFKFLNSKCAPLAYNSEFNELVNDCSIHAKVPEKASKVLAGICKKYEITRAQLLRMAMLYMLNNVEDFEVE